MLHLMDFTFVKLSTWPLKQVNKIMQIALVLVDMQKLFLL